MSPFLAFVSMLALLPIVLLLAWAEMLVEDWAERGEPQRNTWPSEDIEA